MKQTEQGFTLLELLVAIALLAALMMLLADGIGLVSHRLDRSIERRDRATAMALVQNYLRAALGQTLPVAVASDAASVIDFDGSAAHLAFVTRAPASAPLGGMIKLDLHFAPGERGAAGALILDWQPYRDLGRELEVGETRAGTRRLLAGVREVAFAYFDPGAPDRPGGWRDDWHDMPVLPTLARMSLAFSNGETMPDLVAALRLSTPATANPPQPAPQKTQ